MQSVREYLTFCQETTTRNMASTVAVAAADSTVSSDVNVKSNSATTTLMGINNIKNRAKA